MSVSSILTDVESVVALGAKAVSAGMDAAPYLLQAHDLLSGKRVLTASERSDLQAKQSDLEDQIDLAAAGS